MLILIITDIGYGTAEGDNPALDVEGTQASHPLASPMVESPQNTKG